MISVFVWFDFGSQIIVFVLTLRFVWRHCSNDANVCVNLLYLSMMQPMAESIVGVLECRSRFGALFSCFSANDTISKEKKWLWLFVFGPQQKKYSFFTNSSSSSSSSARILHVVFMGGMCERVCMVVAKQCWRM